MDVFAAGLDGSHALVGRRGCVGIGAEADGGSAKVTLMVFDVTTTEFRVRAMRCLRKIAIYGGAHGFGIAGEDVSIDSAGFACVGGIAIAGGTVDEESDGVGVCDFNCGVVVLCRQDLAACRDGEQLCMKAHAGLMFLYRQAGVVVNGKRLALHEEPIVR